MHVSRLAPQGLLLLRTPVHRDERGFFRERFRTECLAELGLPARFAQENHARSEPGVLRGLHYQHRPPQGKLVGVIRGRVWDVAVDLRPGSPAFGRHSGVELDGEDGQLLWVPPGFAHGYCVLGGEAADVVYLTDAAYDPAGEGGIRWDDPELGIPWPLHDPILSERDRNLGSFAAYRACGPVTAPASANVSD
jgi:dTDP-4-dehydrorhamnose 3,5-epimerase